MLYLCYNYFLYFTAAVFLIFIHGGSIEIQTAYHDSLKDLPKSQKEVKKLATNQAFISQGQWIGWDFNDIQKRLIADFINKH